MASESSTTASSTSFVLMDGGLATACEERGHDLSSALWSARLLKDAPDELLAVHRDFIQAGARIVVTASYQACVELLRGDAFGATDAMDLMKSSVHIAKNALRTTGEKLLVAGSVGSYGACLGGGQEYSGGYVASSHPQAAAQYSSTEGVLKAHVSLEQLSGWHIPRIQALLCGGCDILACETLPCTAEITAIGTALDSLPGGATTPVAITMTLRDACTCASGEPLSLAVTQAVHTFGPRLVAFGVNCCPPHLVEGALLDIKHTIHTLQDDITIASYSSPSGAFAGLMRSVQAVHAGEATRATVHLTAYPNSGEAWDAQTKTWYTQTSGISATPQNDDWAALCCAWLRAGASILGGCCRCGPPFIARLHELQTTTAKPSTA